MKDKLILALASLFGIGYIPFIPGTASCLPALLLFWFIANEVFFAVITLFSLGLAFFISGKAERALNCKDSKKIVIDDFSGMLVSFLFIRPSLLYLAVGFICFRFFDILKVYPAGKIEKKRGSLAVVGDDLVAGAYTNLILHFLRLILKISS